MKSKYVMIIGGPAIALLMYNAGQVRGKEVDKPHRRPNILFIMTDDQGSWTVGSDSYPNAHTPELDKLTSQGVLFKNAFAVSAVCSPSRAAMMSGRYPSETGVLDFIPFDSQVGVDTSLILWPKLFQNAGYRTALVGKWHIGSANMSYYPEQRGFDKFSGFLVGGRQSRDPVVRMEGKDTVFNNKYTSDVLTDLALRYIREFKEDPWVVCLNYWAPHANTNFPADFRRSNNDRSWLPLGEEDLAHWKDNDILFPEPDFPKLDKKSLDRMMREYYASVNSVDRNLGHIMKLLKELNIDQNTIVIFTSDNGFMMGHHGLWHKGNGRWITVDKTDPDGIYAGEGRPNMYDLSLRVPFIIRWPEQIEAGKKIEHTVTLLDVYPTLLEMAGIDKPTDMILRGNSFFPLLKGTNKKWEDVFYAQYLTLRSVQTSKWKYVCHFEDTTKNELYDLTRDPREKINLIRSDVFSKKKRELKSLLLNEMKRINDPIIKTIDFDVNK